MDIHEPGELEQSNQDIDSVDNNRSDKESIVVTLENDGDEIKSPNSDVEESSDSEKSDREVTGVTTRLGKTSRQFDWERNDPSSIYGSFYFAKENIDILICLCAYYQDEHLNRHIGAGIIYGTSFFISALEVTEKDVPIVKEQITSIAGVDK